jgi:hypothetical protein
MAKDITIKNGVIAMMNAAKAYLKTEGNLTYRECEIRYYTYSMFETPNKYRVNVNVYLHHTQNNYIKTLALDECFDKETAAIDYGVDAGKRFIDLSYDQGKIVIVKTELPLIAKNDKAAKTVKPVKNEKTKSDKK